MSMGFGSKVLAGGFWVLGFQERSYARGEAWMVMMVMLEKMRSSLELELGWGRR